VLNSIFPLVTLDVRNSESIQAALQNHHSSGRLDIVINNAGVGITGPLEEIPSEEIKITLRLTSIEVMKAALPQMRTQKSGLIINILLLLDMGLPYRSIYSASKGFRTNNRGSSHGSKVLWDSYHERCSGDFALLLPVVIMHLLSRALCL
jgi:NADP-dependent 3-hydroxy acid dehydrogenase YdfG